MRPAGGHWLLIHRQIGARYERADYRGFAPANPTLEQMVAVAGKRWAVEECFETAKGECGLKVGWMNTKCAPARGWPRPITLSLLAPAYLTVVRGQAARSEPHQKRRSSRNKSSFH